MSDQQGIATFEIEITLLEDLHTGTGMGSAVVDRLLARAGDGVPLIPREHLKGVWRDNARRLAHLGRLGTDGEATVRTLFGSDFGSDGGIRGCLICPELRPEPQDPLQSLYWDATARKAGDRAPDDHSLRRTEYLPAGAQLSGRGVLSENSKALRDALERIVCFTNALGSERTRGSGLVQAHIDWIDAADTAPQYVFASQTPPAPDPSAGIRLFLRTQAPLCIPKTGAPGNVIPSEHLIPGRTLLGALAAWIAEQGKRADVLFERRLAVGPAYPLQLDLACADSSALAGIQVIPIPLNLWTRKPNPGPQDTWPHWAGGLADESPAEATASLEFQDMFDKADDASDGDEDQWRPDKTRNKRPKDNTYLFREGNTGGWCYFEASLGLRMRNRRGDPLRDVLENETDLFTVEQLPTGSRFVADIVPMVRADADSVQALLDQLSPLLTSDAMAAPLRIGRGGTPVVIEGWSVIGPVARSKTTDTATRLTLTLVTDLIARAPDLGFHTELSLEAVRDCLGSDAAETIQCDKGDSARGFSDSVRQIGFNAVAGLPTAPRLAIRRGSILQVEGASVPALRSALKDLTAIGERTWEGNGRFLLDLAPVNGDIHQVLARTAVDDPASATRARCDRVIRAARDLCAEKKAVDWLPSASQLGNLRARLAAEPPTMTAGKLDKLLRGYRQEVQARRSGEQWVRIFDEIKLPDKLRTACCEVDHCRTEDVELYLRVLTLHKSDAERKGRGSDSTGPSSEEAREEAWVETREESNQ